MHVKTTRSVNVSAKVIGRISSNRKTGLINTLLLITATLAIITDITKATTTAAAATTTTTGGTRWRSWLRHCAASRKVAGWIPDGVTENFQ